MRKSAGAAARLGFTGFACLDFSARASRSPVKASADACWFGAAGEAAGYHRTRLEAWAAVQAWAREAAGVGPVLLGIDFALGFPAGTAAALGVDGWRGVWGLLAAELGEDRADNGNDRFAAAGRLNQRVGAGPGAGPWWACPAGAASPWLTTRRGFDWPVEGLARLRRADAACPGVQEVWKLAGAGSVGSQTLLGVAGLVRLGERLAGQGVTLRVWPFEREREPVAGELWVAECWPGLLDAEVRAAAAAGRIRDAAQVEAWTAWAEHHVGDPWEEPLPLEAAEEGWILGAKPRLVAAGDA